MRSKLRSQWAPALTGLPSPKALLAMLASLLAIIALLLNLGVQPLFREEPRRVMVAMELWANQNLIVPHQLGELYYKKPPFFNWVLLLIAQLWGDYAEWAMRLPTVLSTLATGGLTLWMGRRYVNAELGWLAGLLFICAGGILFDFSMLAEIDLFYSMITYAGMLSIFHFFQKKQYFLLFLVPYILAAIGVLTKGLPSIVFVGVSLLVFLVSEKKWRLLFSWQHIFSGLIFLLITGTYLWSYAQYSDLMPFLKMQLGESSQRTVAEQGLWSLLQHLINYPLDMLKNLLPGGLLLLFLIRRDVWKLIRSNPFIYFSTILFLANLLPYWLAPGARQRYIYMLYPFAIIILVYAYQHRSVLANWRTNFFSGISGFLLIVLLLVSLALPFFPAFSFLSYKYWLAPIFGLVLVTLIYGFYRHRKLAIYWLILATLVGRIIFDLTVLPQRAHNSGAQADQRLAQQIHEIVGDENVYLYYYQRISFTTVVYLNKIREKPLIRMPEKNTRDFFLLQKVAYDDPRKTYLTFEYSGQEYELVKFQ